MPIYEYQCQCGYKGDHVGKIEDNEFPCIKCNGKMKRQFHSRFGINMGVGPYGYFDETLGCHISTNEQKRRVMKDQGVTEKFGKGWQ